MLRPLYTYKTRCCSSPEQAWQYALALRIFPCQKCGSIGSGFAAPPVEVPLPIASAHSPSFSPRKCVRVAFKVAKKDGGFLNYKLGDDLHCGLVDTRGTVTSFVPNVEVRRELRSWEQAIIVIPSGLSAVSADHWDGVILKMRQQVRDNFPTCEFDCLDFAVMVLNEALQRVEFNRNSVSELMCRQLKHVMHYANLQREAMLKQL